MPSKDVGSRSFITFEDSKLDFTDAEMEILTVPLEEFKRIPSRSNDLKAFTPFVISIAGGTASGKTTVCRKITQHLGDQRVVLVSLDEFYRDLTPEECRRITDINFDEPAAFDIKSMVECLDALIRCEAVDVPVYDFVTSRRSTTQVRHIPAADVVIIEGILVLHIPEILQRSNMKIFVDTDDDVRLARRIRRDTVERGRDVEGVISQYTRFVKPSFEKYILPSKSNADVIIPWQDDNRVAVDLITQHIRSKLSVQDLRRIFPNLHVMPSTMQTRGMHTKIRCRETSRIDFIFYADRLIRLLIEEGLGMLPFSDETVITPAGEPYLGVHFSSNLCGVSIIRSGEAMENALRSSCAGIKIGKILIHRSGDNGAHIAYEKLPHDISERHVLLMDPILATGTSMIHAVQVLTQHKNVDESKIILLTLIAAPEGIRRVCSRFPKMRVLTTEIDRTTGSDRAPRPGIGDFGDRYFGTTETCDTGLITLSPRSTSSPAGEGSIGS
jgi:uridine kinase